jgi:hypothetical protein
MRSTGGMSRSWRLAGLAAAFLLGLVTSGQLFTGFGNPAVVTVIEILIIAQAIGHSRVLDVLARKVAGLALGETTTVALLCAMGAAISVFMNNRRNGVDSFVFDFKAGKKNADTILDFKAGVDPISLDDGVFRKLHDDGVLKGKFFAFGKTDDSNDYLVYRE